jgi:hypothetical protein
MVGVGEGKAASVARHMGMGLQIEAGHGAGPFDHLRKAKRREGRAALHSRTRTMTPGFRVGACEVLAFGRRTKDFDHSRGHLFEFSDGDDFSGKHDLGHRGGHRNLAASGQADRQQG